MKGKEYSRRRFLKTATIAGAGVLLSSQSAMSALSVKGIPNGHRIGVIGLDTGHGPHFAKILNDPNAGDKFGGFKVVAAYPYGSRTIKSSVDMIPGNTKEIKEVGVKIVDSIDELLKRVDVVMLETNDGRLHLEQALKVFKSGKPVFVDKPVAASLADTLTIYRAAKHYQVPVFSSSTLRYIPSVQKVANGGIGNVGGADVFTPAPIEKTHPDFFWYAIHGVEMLFTMLGAECKSVSRTYTPNADFAVGIWGDKRIGALRGNRNGCWDFGGQAFGEGGKNMALGNFTGYAPLMPPIISFFQTGKSPVDEAQTIGIYAFMEAAQVSKYRNGTQVSIEEVMQKALYRSSKTKI